MSKQLRELQARKATLVKDARALTDIAAAEQRDLNEEEVSAFEALVSLWVNLAFGVPLGQGLAQPKLAPPEKSG